MITLRNGSIAIASLLILLFSCFTAAAVSVSDGTGDIWHWAQSASGTSWSWQGNIQNKPNIDITDISYTVNDDTITLRMQVSGTIQASEKVIYWIYLNGTDSQYWFTYTNGSGTGFGMKGMNFTTQDNISVSGNTMSVVLDALGDTSQAELWGYAVEYTTMGDQTAEWWGDWAPNDKFPNYGETTDDTDEEDETDTDDASDDTTNDDSGAKTDTPGFEMFLVVAAVTIALIVFRKKR